MTMISVRNKRSHTEYVINHVINHVYTIGTHLSLQKLTAESKFPSKASPTAAKAPAEHPQYVTFDG